MTVKETGKIMDILESAYPQFYKSQADEERTKATKLWAAMFADDDLAVVAAAVKAFIATDTKGFPPVIGIIKSKIADIVSHDKMTEYEAWNRVKEAIGNGIYGAEEEFAKLPPVLQRLVGSAYQIQEWARNMDSKTLESVVGSNFMRSYRARAEYEREDLMLPSDLKKFIEAFSERMKLPEAEKQLTEFEVNDRRNEIRRQLEEAN